MMHDPGLDKLTESIVQHWKTVHEQILLNSYSQLLSFLSVCSLFTEELLF